VAVGVSQCLQIDGLQLAQSHLLDAGYLLEELDGALDVVGVDVETSYLAGAVQSELEPLHRPPGLLRLLAPAVELLQLLQLSHASA